MLKSYLELSKPGIVTLILVTTAIGFYFGADGIPSYSVFLMTLFGTAGSSAGASALNHYLEKDLDMLMNRTKNRPLPSGKISQNAALLYGILLSVGGSIFLSFFINLLCGFLSLLTVFLYVLVYTPMKRITWLNTMIGAIPGALPIMGGWAASTGELSLGAWILFLIMFAWQHPHFFSIAWLLKDDYARAGFKMLPVIHPDGRSTVLQIIIFSLFLLVVSVLPTIFGFSGMIYFYGAAILGLIMILYSIKMSFTFARQDARALFLYSIIYLPCLLVLIIFDKAFL